jgi:hypothetical protein
MAGRGRLMIDHLADELSKLLKYANRSTISRSER